MPRECPTGPGVGVGELEAIARVEARRSPSLAPNGGWRWTVEDIAFAVAILDEAMRSRAFLKAWSRGMARDQAQRWLSKALHNGVLKHALRTRRCKLLDALTLDALPAPRGSPGRLEGDDATALAARLRGSLSREERLELAQRCRGNGIGSASARRAAKGPSRATRARLWRRVCSSLQEMVVDEGLTREQAGEVVLALAAELAVDARRSLPGNL